MRYWIRHLLLCSIFFYLTTVIDAVYASPLDARSKRVFDEVISLAKKNNNKLFCHINFHEGLRDVFLTSTVKNISDIQISNQTPNRPSERTYIFQITIPRLNESPEMIWVEATYFKGKCENVVVGRIATEPVF
jgi:hypothetical protein